MFKVLKNTNKKLLKFSKPFAILRPKNEKAWDNKAQEKWSRIRLSIDIFATAMLTLGVFEILCNIGIVCLDINSEWLNSFMVLLDGLVFIIIQAVSLVIKIIVHISSLFAKKMESV